MDNGGRVALGTVGEAMPQLPIERPQLGNTTNCVSISVVTGDVDEVENGIATERRSEGLIRRASRNGSARGDSSAAGVEPLHI